MQQLKTKITVTQLIVSIRELTLNNSNKILKLQGKHFFEFSIGVYFHDSVCNIN